jgi:hypothetical protein
VQAAASPSVLGASALIASTLIAVTPVASPPQLHLVSDATVRLVDASSGLLGDLGLGSLSGLFSDLGSSSSGLFGDGSILNIPYNIFADIVNIPYTESLALQEYAYALGPAGSAGGVEGWIPPGATTLDGGAVMAPDGGLEYALGGTGSWWQESIGNTWGWDNGNWPQLDALWHFFLPLQWTEGLTESIQSVAQSSFIAGSAVNCEFECSNLVGYLGGWLTHLGNVFSSTYPVTQTDTIGSNVGDVVNVGPLGSELTAIWSGQQVPINPLLEPFEAIWQNAIESPSLNPIQLPNIGDVFDSAVKLGQDLINDFNPFIEGSFVYWGADTLYSIPSVIGGLIHTLSLGLIPNEFVLPDNGAMPVDGYNEGITNLLPNLQQGVQYLIDGLLKYLDPSTWGASAADASTAAAASADVSTLLGSLGDQGGLLADLSSAMPNLSTDLASMLGPSLGTDLASMFPQLSADLSSWFPDLAAALIP